jgi:AcrR family transcriptional regulator
MNRLRLIHAAAELACEESLEAVRVERVAGLAGTSTQVFLEEFDSVSACLRAGTEMALARAARKAQHAAGSGRPRPPAALDGLLDFAEQEPELAGLGVLVACSEQGCETPPPAAAWQPLEPALSLVAGALSAIGDRPGLHPQRLAARAGLASQAQADRLLARLEALGLVAAAGQQIVATPAGRAFRRLQLS